MQRVRCTRGWVLGSGALSGLGLVLLLSTHGARAAHQPVATGAPAAPVKSAGCGHPMVSSAASARKAVDGRNIPRGYLLVVPQNYDAGRAYPLVFVFHGAGTSSQQSYSWGLQNAAGAAANGIFVFPDGAAFQRYGIGWDDGPDGYDLPFFDNMMRDVEAAYCVDTSRLFVAGFSWGGDFAIALACHRGDKIRAVAANSTDDEFRDTANFRTYSGLPCRAQQHPAVRFGHALGGDSQYPAPDFATTSKLFQYLNSCASESVPAKSSTPELSCVTYNSCVSEFTECTFDTRIGHALPPRWAQDTWDFFARF